jgi:hypothetical protein
MDNIYVVEYNKRVKVAQKSTNILLREGDEIIRLGMSMQPQEEDKEEQKGRV